MIVLRALRARNTILVSVFQWISSSSDARFVEAMREGFGSVGMWDEGPIVRVNGPLAIFDAALPGIEASTDELLFVEIEPTAYRVRTADIESDTGTCARVHRLDPVTEISTAI